MNIKTLLFAACVFFAANVAQATPVVTYTSSGSSGDWTVNFSILNNLSANSIFWFGIDAPAATIIENDTPTGWPAAWSTSLSGYGSSSVADYNNTWYYVFGYEITPGQTLDGFKVSYNTVAAPTSVSWFAFAFGDPYVKNDSFNVGHPFNIDNMTPGFEGVATAVVMIVPEPQGYAMLLVGVGLLGFTIRRRRNTNA